MAAIGKFVVGVIVIVALVAVCKGLGGEWMLDQIPTK